MATSDTETQATAHRTTLKSHSLAFSWFLTVIKAVEQYDQQLGRYLSKIPDKVKGLVMSLTNDYSGLELTALQRATLSGNLMAGNSPAAPAQVCTAGALRPLAGGLRDLFVAVKALNAADAQLVGVQQPVSLRGVDPSSWRSELPPDCPACMMDVLRLCTELDWLHLAVLSGHAATAELVHGLTASSDSRPSVFTPALLSVFAHPVMASQRPGDVSFSEAILIPDIVVGQSCTPDFMRDVWSLGVALTSSVHLLELSHHLVRLAAKRTSAKPFQIQAHLSLLPAMLPSISFKGIVVSSGQRMHKRAHERACA